MNLFRRQPKVSMEFAEKLIEQLSVEAEKVVKTSYTSGFADGVRSTLGQLDGNGALVPDTVYGGPIPDELRMWIANARVGVEAL